MGGESRVGWRKMNDGSTLYSGFRVATCMFIQLQGPLVACHLPDETVRSTISCLNVSI